jgi:hypothetical protein
LLTVIDRTINLYIVGIQELPAYAETQDNTTYSIKNIYNLKPEPQLTKVLPTQVMRR